MGSRGNKIARFSGGPFHLRRMRSSPVSGAGVGHLQVSALEAIRATFGRFEDCD